jgi:hypothetical protein
MKYLYILGALLLVSAGIYISMTWELQPPSKAIIAYEQVDSPQDLGTRVAQKLLPELQKQPLVILGVTPNQVEDLEFVRGFLTETSQNNFGYEMVIVEPLLPHIDMIPSQLKIDFKAELNRFASGVTESLSQGLRVAVVVPSIYASQLLAGNPADRLKQEYNLNFISITVSPFPLTAQQAETFDPPCVGEKGHDHTGTGKLGCAIQQVARRAARHKLQQGKYSTMVERFGPEDYLVLLNRN